ncbi:MAG TPA: helix-turn-helix domain-containing protein [Pseudonocardia sp.]
MTTQPAEQATQPGERLRRPSEQVQALILGAARELFQVKGYGATTTKEIAARAGVAEALLFTNFGSKAHLFEIAISGPFDEFVDDYIRGWQQTAGGASELERLEGFVRGLMDLTERNRGLLVDAISPRSNASSNGPDSARAAVLSGVSRAFQRVHVLDEGPHPWKFEPTAMLAATHGLVMSTVLLDQLLFPARGPIPDRDTLVAELARFMLYGLTGPDRT